MEHGGVGDTNCNQYSRYSHQRIGKGTGGTENNMTSGDHPNYSFIKNTEKGPGDLRKLAVTQTLVEDHQLTVV